MVITMAKLRMAHASTHGARKPPGPKKKNTPGTRGWSRLRDRTLAIQKKRAKINFFFLVKKNYYLNKKIKASRTRKEKAV